MHTKVLHPAVQPLLPGAAPARQPAPVGTKAAPEKIDLAQAARAVDAAQKPASVPTALNSALTTYKDQDSGRLIVRVYDRESGDVLVEFPPEKAFRAAVVPGKAAQKPKKSFSA